jgi:hypothetical protein
MSWRGWDEYLNDTSQSAADAVTRTDNGDGNPTSEEVRSIAWMIWTAFDVDSDYS